MSRTYRTGWQKIFYSNWFLISNIVLLVVLMVAHGQRFYYDYQIKKEIKHFKEEAKNLELKKSETLDLLNYINSNDYIEQKARTELNMIKPGEKLAIFESSSGTIHRQNKESVIKNNKLSNPKRWWNYFFGN